MIEDFWKYVRKQPNGCWVWKGPLHSRGYGLYRGKFYTHRLSYTFKFGKIPKGKCICHKCDVKACVRPSHLWVGTQAENLADMRAKGRNNDVSGMLGRRHKVETKLQISESLRIYHANRNR